MITKLFTSKSELKCSFVQLKQFLFCLLLSVAMPSLAYDFEQGGLRYNYYYTPSGTAAYVTRDIDSPYSGSINIPPYVIKGGYKIPIIAIGAEAFAGCRGLTAVTIPNSVTKIDEAAFHSCPGLKSITIPNSVKTIGDYAFKNCTGLKTITIPNSVITIGEGAFENCTELTSAPIPNSVKNMGIGIFDGCTKLTANSSSEEKTAYVNGIRYRVLDATAKTCEVTYEKFVERNSVRNLYASSYSGYIVIPEKVKMFNNVYTVVAVGEQAFRCSGVTQIELPNTIKKIGLGAFYSASKLNDIVLPASVTEIGSSAFHECRWLSTVTMGGNVTKLGTYAFCNCVCLKTVKLSNKLKELPERAFAMCENLTTVNIPISLTTIGEAAFGGCDKLTLLTMPTTLKSVGNLAFYKCKHLEIKGIPATAKIASDAFDLCKHKYNIIQKKTSVKYGAAMVAKVVAVFKKESSINGLALPLMELPIGTPYALLKELGQVMDGEYSQFVTTYPYKEYVKGNARFQCYKFNHNYLTFKNGRLFTKGNPYEY